jgi:signal transduction histidine kinase
VAAERERAEAAEQTATIATHRGLLLEILNGLGEGLLAVDRSRHVVLANARFAEMFNATVDLVGRPLGEAARAAAVFAAFDDALAGREASARFPLRTGVAERKIEMRAFPLHADDIAAVALFLDVTQIERLEQIRRNFISDFSHEVRTPLAAMRSAVESFELGAEHMTVEEDQQLRRIMTRQLARLERLVNDLSELSNIESGDISLDRIEVDLLAVVRDLCEDFAERATNHGVRFNISGDHVRVCADPVRVQQAFSNLIDNAIKYGARNDSIDIDVRAEEDNAVVAITDHGEGIAPEEKERIFRRFYRIDQSRSQEIAGTGLGLAITKHLILLHRGSIDVVSTPGEGATFIVRLPRT